MTQAQTSLYDQGQTGTQQDIIHALNKGRLSRQEKRALLEQVQCGNEQACEALFSHLQERYLTYAYRREWSKFTRGFDTADLVQEGLLQAWRMFERSLRQPDPITYLVAVGYRAMRTYCYEYRSLVKRDSALHVEPVPVVSLDQPITTMNEEKAATWAEFLPCPSENEASSHNFTALYAAIEQLTEMQREAIIRSFGLFEAPAETLHDLAGGAVNHNDPAYKRMSHRKEKGVAALRRLLRDVYCADDEATTSSKGYHPAPLTVQFTRTQRAKLDRAYDVLQASGETITTRRLSKESKVSYGVCPTYLRQRRQAQGSPVNA